MSVTKTTKKTRAPQIIKLGKALKLVNNMSKDANDDRTNVDLEGHPSGLGLGAKVSRQSKFVPSNDPVERKLYAKLNAEKRKNHQKTAEGGVLSKNGGANSTQAHLGPPEDSSRRRKARRKGPAP
ncbi:hypothetical protein AAZX31_17G170200 [Glycine max]